MFQALKSKYDALKNLLKSKGQILGDKIRSLFGKGINSDTVEELEELLYQSDLGVEVIDHLVTKVKEQLRKQHTLSVEELITFLKAEMKALLHTVETPILSTVKPHVILVIGSNGYGKTTSIAKLAHYYKQQGKKVLVVAGDTFRAAATEQLDTWAERINIDIVKGQINSNPSAVVFDGMSAAKARESDIVIIDTAGRLHTKSHLMQELEKIRRVVAKGCEGAPHETLLVLDATTGLTAVDQAKIFNTYTPITGIILSKFDGTAKGGAVVAIHKKTGIPVKWLGTGEGVEDLEQFEIDHFIDTLFEKI